MEETKQENADIKDPINNFEEIIDSLDQSKSFLNDFEIAEAIRKACPSENITFEMRWEVNAFSFNEAHPDNETSWGTYFGPMQTIQDSDGTIHSFPDINEINEEVLAYWKNRASASQNPWMKARYAGLIWDFSKSAGLKNDVKICITYIENLLESVRLSPITAGRNLYQWLDRAVELSISIKNDVLLSQARDLVLHLNKGLTVGDFPILLPMAFRVLLERKGTKTTPDQEKEIVQKLEGLLSEATNSINIDQPFDPWVADTIGKPLISYYKSTKSDADLNRVAKTVGNFFIRAASHTDPLLKSAWLQHALEIFNEGKLSDEAEKLLAEIEKLGPEINNSLSEFSTQITIDQAEFDAMLDQMTQGTFEESMQRIALNFIPRQDQLDSQLDELSASNPFTYFINRQIQANDGRIVAVVGSIEKDREGHLVCLLNQNIQLSTMFLAKALERAKEKFTIDVKKFVDFLFLSPAFDPSKRPIIERAILAYLED